MVLPFTDVPLSPEEQAAILSLATGESGDKHVEERFAMMLVLGMRVFKERQKKYGRSNIARAGEKGVVIRVGDKLARLEHLGTSTDAVDESVADTWIDVGNYGFIGLMTHFGLWPAPILINGVRPGVKA